MRKRANKNSSTGPMAASFELDDEALYVVNGGAANEEEIMPCDADVRQLQVNAEALMMNPNVSREDKALLQSALTSLTSCITKVGSNPEDLEKIIRELESKYLVP